MRVRVTTTKPSGTAAVQRAAACVIAIGRLQATGAAEGAGMSARTILARLVLRSCGSGCERRAGDRNVVVDTDISGDPILVEARSAVVSLIAGQLRLLLLTALLS